MAVFSLAMNAMVGNQESLPQNKMLTRLVSKFMFEPEPLARLRWRMCQAGRRAGQSSACCGDAPSCCSTARAP